MESDGLDDHSVGLHTKDFEVHRTEEIKSAWGEGGVRSDAMFEKDN